MSTFFAKDINQLYTEKIQEYLAKGYILSPLTHSRNECDVTCYNEMYHKKDKDILIRVYLISYYDYHKCCNRINIQTVKFDHTSKPEEKYRMKYRSNGELIEDLSFFCVNGNNSYRNANSKKELMYTDNSDEFNKIIDKIKSRHKLADELKRIKSGTMKVIPLEKMSNRFIDLVMEKINKRNGFKKATALCIKRITVRHYFERDKSRRLNTSIAMTVDFGTENRSDTLYFTQYVRS